MARELNDTNTFYHAESKLDITDPDPAWHESLDSSIASDVFEHVEPPVERAFEGACRVSKAGGFVVFSVPFTIEDGTTIEHFLHPAK